jgi:hypothetical protein
MNRLRNCALMLAGFALLAVIASGISGVPALAQIVKSAIIKNIDEPGRSPYSSSSSCAAANQCTLSFTAVPANKRLVAQFVSINLQSSSAIAINGQAFLGDGVSNYADVFVPRVDSFNAVNSQPITAYIDAGRVPKLSAALTGSTNVQAHGILTGYLVDLSQ